MKRILLLATIILSSLIAVRAQKTPLNKYEIAPASFEHVFLDHIENFRAKTIDVGSNQYWGQVAKDGSLYGYGTFINSDGSQIIGKYRNDQLIFGITITQTAAVVGDLKHYASYSLTTGRLEFIFQSNEKVVVDTRNQLDYGFVSMKYSNGDQYMGEVYQRKRHGVGIYYYTNGDYWFGEYDNDIRSGFGALFHVDGDIEIGQWEGEDAKRLIHVQAK